MTTAVAIHHVGIQRRSVPVHAGIAVDMQGRRAFGLIDFRTTKHMRLWSICDLSQTFETAGT